MTSRPTAKAFTDCWINCFTSYQATSALISGYAWFVHERFDARVPPGQILLIFVKLCNIHFVILIWMF